MDFFVALFAAMRIGYQDPLKIGQELIVIVIVIIALIFIYKYRTRVIQALTGDDRFHFNILDGVWWCCFRCCGLCYGEWTRHCSHFLPCCPHYKDKNLIQELGRWFGVYTIPIELKNIVVGDLPFDSIRGDFYLQVEVGTNPPMVTSLQEDRIPKVVHFPEVLTIRIRYNLAEPRVRILVKELNVVGHNEICDLKLSAMSILDWSNDADPMKRFAMKPTHRDIEWETQPWICVEFSSVTEVRHIGGIQDNHPSYMKVRTWVPNSVFGKDRLPGKVYRDQNKMEKQSKPFLDLWSHGDGEKRNLYEQEMADFKESFPLRDESGNPLDVEVAEDDLAKVEHLRGLLVCMVDSCNCFAIVLLLGYCFVRFYIFSCYRQFRLLEMANANGTSFPVSTDTLSDMKKDCDRQFAGTGLASDGSSYCRPSRDQIEFYCEHGVQHPVAGRMLMREWFDVKNAPGFECLGEICRYRGQMVDNHVDEWTVLVVFVLIISTCLCRCMANSCVIRYRTKLQRKRATEQTDLKVRLKTQSAMSPRSNLGGGIFG